MYIPLIGFLILFILFFGEFKTDKKEEEHELGDYP